MDWLIAAPETRYVPLCTAAVSCPIRAALSENDVDQALDVPETATLSRRLGPELEVPAADVFRPVAAFSAADRAEFALVASVDPAALPVSR